MGIPESRPEHELPTDMDERLPNIFLFGDSITESSFDTEGGCSPDHATGMVLRKRWKKKCNVVNFGKGGQTTRSLKGYFEDEILHFSYPDLGFPFLSPPRLITIWLGANDGSLPDSPAHVPIDEYEENLREYVDKILETKGWHNTKILLMTCPPVDRDPNDGNIKIPPTTDPHEGEGYIDWRSRRLYAERVMKVAKSYNGDRVRGLDVWTMFVKNALKDLDRDWDEEKLPGSCLRGAPRFPGSGVDGKGYLSDGLHVGDKGYDFVTKAILDICNDHWPDVLKDIESKLNPEEGDPYALIDDSEWVQCFGEPQQKSCGCVYGAECIECSQKYPPYKVDIGHPKQ